MAASIVISDSGQRRCRKPGWRDTGGGRGESAVGPAVLVVHGKRSCATAIRLAATTSAAQYHSARRYDRLDPPSLLTVFSSVLRSVCFVTTPTPLRGPAWFLVTSLFVFPTLDPTAYPRPYASSAPYVLAYLVRVAVPSGLQAVSSHLSGIRVTCSPANSTCRRLHPIGEPSHNHVPSRQ